MPVITFANSKGGSGKTTSALLLACDLAERHSVSVIDADPRRPISAWAELAPPYCGIEVINSKGQNHIQDEIDDAAAKSAYVVVDLEGMASQLATFAMQASDLVIIPSQEQQQDAEAALDTLAAVSRAARAVRRDIPAAIVLTRTKAAVKSRTQRFIGGQLRETKGAYILEPEIIERDAFAALYACGGGLRQLDVGEVNGVTKAIDNAAAYARAVEKLLGELYDMEGISA